MTKSGRVSIFAGVVALALGLIIFTVMAFLRTNPQVVDFTTGNTSGQAIHMDVETVGAIGPALDPTHPTWVSYLTKDPQTGDWVHSTLWRLPAHTKIDMTIYQFDSGSPLRNPQIGLIRGVDGGAYTLNGKTRVSLVNATLGNGVAHTFSVPSLGINIPMLGVNGNAKNFCNAGPCNPATQATNKVQFSFTTPGPGQYRFQCFVPCGLDYLFGNGGPMSTVGFMGGFLEVV